MEKSGHHFIAIFGGAVAGSEAAFQLANRGFRVVVFDQNVLPYGKIEDGLPKWHDKLRDKEEQRINEKLSHPNVRFVPLATLGEKIDFLDVVNNWGFSAVLLATGAWKDRPLPVEGIDDYINKGLYYQNPLVYWFNHYHEPTYQGDHFELQDNAMVIGGGLASLDVVKILQIENVQKALRERGHEVDMFTLDRGINKVLDSLGYTMDDLGLKGCALFYRRRDIDMPLSPLPTDTPEQLEKAQGVRKKIMDNFLKKYLFRFEPCWAPVDKIVEGEQVTGILFQKTKIEDGRVVPVDGEFKEFRSPLIISSIGSLPEKITGIPSKGSTFEIDEKNCCRLIGFDNVFALGNAVTGRGNIKESMEHGKKIALKVMEHHLDWQEEDYEEWLRKSEGSVQEQVENIARQVEHKDYLPEETIRNILDRTAAMQAEVGYPGKFMDWVAQKLPVRLEDMLEKDH
ncbi:MAG: FAD-dependent oxidoreductase [Cyclobacteriaceae bacterium]|nr:FAD-dependent oxidoreductase [Cyclobacteriaceae bacterium]